MVGCKNHVPIRLPHIPSMAAKIQGIRLDLLEDTIARTCCVASSGEATRVT